MMADKTQVLQVSRLLNRLFSNATLRFGSLLRSHLQLNGWATYVAGFDTELLFFVQFALVFKYETTDNIQKPSDVK